MDSARIDRYKEFLDENLNLTDSNWTMVEHKNTEHSYIRVFECDVNKIKIEVLECDVALILGHILSQPQSEAKVARTIQVIESFYLQASQLLVLKLRSLQLKYKELESTPVNSSISLAQIPSTSETQIEQLLKDLTYTTQLSHREKVLPLAQKLKLILEDKDFLDFLIPQERHRVSHIYVELLTNLTSQCKIDYKNSLLVATTDSELRGFIEAFSKMLAVVLDNKFTATQRENQIFYRYLKQKR